MPFDLVIKNGMVVDGSGLPAYPADIGVRHGRIDTIGRIRERAREVIDADGLVVAPGFVDGHTHMDAQIFWDPLGTCSCWHGVTTVVMGNCGFTLAPCPESQKHLVVRNLERAEDIAAEAMAAGIERSEERRVGKECCAVCRSRWSPYNKKKKAERCRVKERRYSSNAYMKREGRY